MLEALDLGDLIVHLNHSHFFLFSISDSVIQAQNIFISCFHVNSNVLPLTTKVYNVAKTKPHGPFFVYHQQLHELAIFDNEVM